MEYLEWIVGGWIRPRETLKRLAAEPSWRRGAVPMLGFACLYGLFCLTLWLRGHRPSFMTLPIPAEDFYLWQALFVVPLFGMLWLLFATLAQGMARLLGGRGRLQATAAVIGLSYAVPLLFAFLIPDILVFSLAGFDTLAIAMRFSAPITMIWILSLGTYGVALVHRLALGRALVAVALAFLLQAIVAGLLIR